MSTTQTWEDLQQVEDVREMADVPSKASIAIQSQYAHAPNFKALASIFHESLDATEQLDQLLKDIADARTADGVFLDWWGKRVGVDRLIQVDDEFIRFDDDYFRFLIMYRALCNLSDSSAATMNQLLPQLTDQQVFIVDYQNMSIRSIVVVGSMSDLQITILRAYGLLNRPMGVMTNFLVIYPDDAIFGFAGSDLQPFDQGVFNPGQEFPMNA